MRKSPAEYLKKLLGRTIKTESGCMEYTGCVQKNGYARATINRKTAGAHRHSYELSFGEIPSGMDVCHSCDNRKCINPEHLFIGTRAENMADAVSKGRQARGMMLPQAKLTEENKNAIVEMAVRGNPYKDIGMAFGVSRQVVGRIAIKNGVRRNGISK